MKNWIEIVIGTVITLVIVLIFNLPELPDGYGKLFAYFGVASFPVLIIQFNKHQKSNLKIKTGEFIFALILNTFLILFFVTIGELIFEDIKIFAGR